MKSTKHLTIRHPLIIRSDDLQYIDHFLAGTFMEIRYKATCSDNTEFELTDLNELLSYENPNFRRLKTVQIKGSGLKGKDEPDSLSRVFPPNQVELIFEDKRDMIANPCNIRFKFEDHKDQFAIEDELIKRIRAMRPWYFWFTMVSLVALVNTMMIGISLLTIVLSGLLLLLGQFPFPSDMLIPFFTMEFFPLMGIGIILMGSLYLLDRLRFFILPTCWFCIGKQEQVVAKRQKIALYVTELLGVGIILAIIANLISSFIEKRLFGG
jgi:hypothetical protein